MYHTFFIHSPVDGHTGFFHVLAILNSAVMNTGGHVSFSIMVTSEYVPSSGIAGSYAGSDGKKSACNAGNLGSILGLGRSPGGGHGNPLQYSCPENPYGQRRLADYSPWGCKSVRHDWATKHIIVVLFQVFKEISILIPIVAISICIPTNSARGSPFLHTLSSIYHL